MEESTDKSGYLKINTFKLCVSECLLKNYYTYPMGHLPCVEDGGTLLTEVPRASKILLVTAQFEENSTCE